MDPLSWRDGVTARLGVHLGVIMSNGEIRFHSLAAPHAHIAESVRHLSRGLFKPDHAIRCPSPPTTGTAPSTRTEDLAPSEEPRGRAGRTRFGGAGPLPRVERRH